MKTVCSLTLVSFLGAGPVFAQQAAEHSAHQSAKVDVAATSTTLTEGEVRKVDKEAKKMTIRHGPIVNLDMPAMTMVFQVQDTALLDAAKPGDKIRFAAEKSSGAFVVTRVEPNR